MGGEMASPKSDIKRFVHKHESWLTFAGAFIVFITFVVKEGLREHWQATADALNAARYTFELKKQSSETRADIEELRHYVQTRKSLTESIAENIPAGVSGFEYESPTFFTWFDEKLAGARDMLEDASIIADKLPRDDDEAQKVSALRAEIPKAKKEASEIHQAAQAIDFLNAVDTSNHEKRGGNFTDRLANEPPAWVYHSFQRPPFSRTYKGENPFAARIEEFSGSVFDFRWDADKLARDILLRADKTIKRNEHRATFAWWVSTMLFAMGWSLALIGKLYGVHDADDKE
jgi:hypothetical protein